jgi:PhnB protein
MAVQNPPAGYSSLTPYVIVDDAEAFQRFIQDAFGATQNGDIARDPRGNIMHADFQIGDSHLMFSSANPEWPATGNTILAYIDDCDTVFQKAVDAGATVVRKPITEFYGDRSGMVRDRWGNLWMISTHVEDVPPEEMEKRMKEAFAAATP